MLKLKVKDILALLIPLILLSCTSGNKQDNNQKQNRTPKAKTVLLKSYQPKSKQYIQTFEINPNKTQTIIGKEGTKITFPAGCFGKVKGNIKIQLIECYSIQDMLLNGLSTMTTEGKLLESDGMIYLNAQNEKGDTLQIKKGKRVKVEMPTKKRKDTIQIFNGIRKDNIVTWDLTNIKIKGKVKSKQNKRKQAETIEEDVPVFINPADSLSQAQKKQYKNSTYKYLNYANKYFFSITKMGWINCDRFIKEQSHKLIAKVNSSKEKNIKLYLVLDSLNSILVPSSPMAINEAFTYLAVPKNSAYTLVALAEKKDTTYFGMQHYDKNKEIVNSPKLEPTTQQEIESKLKEQFGKDIWHRPQI